MAEEDLRDLLDLLDASVRDTVEFIRRIVERNHPGGTQAAMSIVEGAFEDIAPIPDSDAVRVRSQNETVQ